MPSAAPKACRTPGCRGTSTDGGTLCPKCKTVHENVYEKQRPNANERGYSDKWRSYRNRYLISNPWCDGKLRYIDEHGTERTLDLHPGVVRQATELDHVKPPRSALNGLPLNVFPKPKEYHRLFWNPDNHQGACKSCHSYKTAKYDSSFARSSVVRPLGAR